MVVVLPYTVQSLYNAWLCSIGMDSVISEPCYKGGSAVAQ